MLYVEKIWSECFVEGRKEMSDNLSSPQTLIVEPLRGGKFLAHKEIVRH